MPWNPDVYNKFKEERYQPFYDLISHIHGKQDMHVIDLGCGTGELTAILADRFAPRKVLGIDSSAEMLVKAPQQNNISFVQRSVEEQMERDEQWDLVVANASLQWVDDHQALFPAIIAKLRKGGQLAVQMPSQKENLLNRILHQLVQEPPFSEALDGWIRHSPVLSLDDYTDLFFSNGAEDIVIYQKVYPIVSRSFNELYEFISGSALVPYMERLKEPVRSQFETAFKQRISQHFTSSPSVYPFKRIILYGTF
jgi:trans-aconitate 2-methyltransferase